MGRVHDQWKSKIHFEWNELQFLKKKRKNQNVP